MEIWPNPLNLNLSQFQEANGRRSGCNWIAATTLISSLTGWTPPRSEQVSHSDRFAQADLFKSNVWNISRQLTRLTRVGKPVSTPIWANRVVLTRRRIWLTRCRHSRKQQHELLGEPGAHPGLHPRVADHDGGAQEHVSEPLEPLSVVPSPQLGLASPYLFLALHVCPLIELCAWKPPVLSARTSGRWG